jgi:copper chaperone CopZ
MYEVSVRDIDCRHCQPKIQALLKKLDPKAEVSIDLLDSVVRVQTLVSREEVIEALEDGGIGVEPSND